MQTKYWHTKSGFRNPEGNSQEGKLSLDTVWWIITRFFKRPYTLGVHLPEDHILSRANALALRETYSEAPSITWLGHASFIFKIGDIEILTDPLLFGAPVSSLLRTMRRIPSPIRGADLSGITTLLISHEHADHIHHPTLKSLGKGNIQSIVPLGVGKKIRKHGFKDAIELDWFDAHTIGDVTITAVPAAHYSNLKNTSLWAGYIISFAADGIQKKIYFGGDSGYGPFFARDIAPYGPFDVACIGIGASELNFPSCAPLVHTNPEQAVRIAQEIGVKKVIGMHWGTMHMADEDPRTLFPRMQEESRRIQYAGEVQVLRIGETIAI